MKPIYSPAGIRYIMESGIIIITAVYIYNGIDNAYLGNASCAEI